MFFEVSMLGVYIWVFRPNIDHLHQWSRLTRTSIYTVPLIPIVAQPKRRCFCDPNWSQMAGSSWCVWSLQFLPSMVGHNHPITSWNLELLSCRFMVVYCYPLLSKKKYIFGRNMSSRRHPIFRWFRIGRVISKTRTQIQLWLFSLVFGDSEASAFWREAWGNPSKHHHRVTHIKT